MLLDIIVAFVLNVGDNPVATISIKDNKSLDGFIDSIKDNKLPMDA